MAAAKYDITIEQGATLVVPVTWKDGEGNPIDMTGYTARMQLRKSATSPDVLLELTTENGGIAVDGGVVTMTFSAEQTSAMTFKTAKYDLELENGGVVTRLIEGSVSVVPEVTR